MVISCKIPYDLEEEELDAVIDLIKSYRQNDERDIKNRLMCSKAIAIAKVDKKIIGTATLKTPNDIYTDNAFLNAKSEYCYDDFPLELGYVVISTEFRNLKIGFKIISYICSTYKNENIFAVTKAENYQSIAININAGFFETGNEFRDRKSSDNLKLFVKLK